jgi:Uma2 family endonuclease
MTAMPHMWTAEEYERLPADDGVRRELIDGVLHVSPSPIDPHQTLAMLLGAVLYRSAPRHLFHVTQGVEVKLDERVRFIPDVLAVRASARRPTARYLARDLVLAVEIESPSSGRMDRITKPAHYHRAGVPHYWRIELGKAAKLITYGAADTGYLITGEHTGLVRLDEPWPVEFDLAELIG